MDTIIGIATGICIPFLLNYLKFPMYSEGVEYYAMVHQSPVNSLCHTLGMPFTVYGLLHAIPALFKLRYREALMVQKFLYVSFMTYGITINWKIGLLSCVVYYIPLLIAGLGYHRRDSLSRGLTITCCALLVQETVGHYLSGDPQSRIDVFSISNAITHAVYYSVSWFFV